MSTRDECVGLLLRNPEAREYLVESARFTRNTKASAHTAAMEGQLMLALTGQMEGVNRDEALIAIGRAIGRCAAPAHNTVLFMVGMLLHGLAKNLTDLQIGAEGRKALEAMQKIVDEHLWSDEASTHANLSSDIWTPDVVEDAVFFATHPDVDLDAVAAALAALNAAEKEAAA